MQEKPKTLIAASVVALIGAIIALVETFMSFSIGGDSNNILLSVGTLLTIAVLFFAIIGSFGSTGQWSWRASMFASFLCGSVIIMAYFYELVGVEVSIMLVATALLTVMFTMNGKEWMDSREPVSMEN